MQMRVCGAALSSVLQSHPVPAFALSASQHGLQAWLKRDISVLWCSELCPVGYLLWSLSPLGVPDFNEKPVGFSLLWLFMETVLRYLPPNACLHGSIHHPVVKILLYHQEISWWLLMFLLSSQQNWLLWVRAAWGVKLDTSSCYLGINLQHLKATQSIVYKWPL